MDFNLAMSCVGPKGYKNCIALRDKMCPANSSAKVKSDVLKLIKLKAACFMRILQKRKSFIANHPKKIEIAQKIINARSDKKIVTFCKTVKMAEAVSNKYVYTGDKGKKKNQKTLEEFNKLSSGVLSTSKMAQEGLDCPDLSVGICLDVDSSKIKAKQILNIKLFFNYFFILNNHKKFLAYVLIDPNDNFPKYVGITTQNLKQRLKGHLNDVKFRPGLNYLKTHWINSLLLKNQFPKIQLIKTCKSLEELKKFERDYIFKYKEPYELINLTSGGDWVGYNAHSRETILKKKNTKAIDQYNILGELVASYEITEDVKKVLNLKSCSHITGCCKRKRKYAYGYIWRYKNDSLGDISDIDIRHLDFNYLVQYDSKGNKIAKFNSAKEAAKILKLKSSSNFSEVIRGTLKSLGGYIWKLEPKFIYFSQDLYNIKYKEINIKTKKSDFQFYCYNLDNKLINIFPSINNAVKSIYPEISASCARKHIKKCYQNEENNYKGYIWKRVSINSSNSENDPNKDNPELIKM